MGKIKESIKALRRTLLGTVWEYPATIISIFAAAVFRSLEIAAIFRPSEGAGLFDVGFVHNAAGFLAYFAAGAVLAEELGKRIKSKYRKLSGYVPAALIAAFFVRCGVTTNNRYLLLEPAAHLNLPVNRVFFCYIAACVLVTVYLMYKRLQTDLPRYTLSVFSSLVKVTVMYGLFAIGLAAVAAVFGLLIVELDSGITSQMELILAAGIYVPAVILCFSSLREKPGKFCRILVGYGLTAILCLSMLVVYVYIAKIAVSGTMPKNELFGVVTALFVCGLPVWTMGQYFRPDFFGRLSLRLPYIFSPFIVLQALCIGMRTEQYGITPSRYAGMALIVFEILYLVLYSIQKGKHTALILPLAALMLSVGLLVPGVNSFAVSARSQGQRLLKLDEETETEDVLWAKYELMKDIKDLGPEGEAFLEEHFPGLGVDIKSYLGLEGEKGDRDGNRFVCLSCDFQRADVSEYRYIIYVECDQTAEENEEIDLANLEFCSEEPEYIGTGAKAEDTGSSGEGVIPEVYRTNLDLSGILQRILMDQEERDFLKRDNFFRVGEDATLFITTSITEIDPSGRLCSVKIRGYLLLKQKP